MKSFLLKLALFLCPIAIVLGPAFLYLRATGELLEYGEIMRRNQEDGALIGMAYSNPIHTLKSRIVIRREPRVIALGTSRSMQLRSIFFKDPKSFYNCGGSVHKIGDLEPFLDSLEDSVPRVILLGLDQNFFNEAWDDLEGAPIDYQSPGRSPGRKFAISSRDFYKDLFRGKIDPGDFPITTSADIGVTANIRGDGYRSDGSYRYAQKLETVEKSSRKAIQSVVERIRAGGGDGRFRPARRINETAVAELTRFLEICRERQVHVIAFLPPYAQRVYEEIVVMGDRYPHVLNLEAALDPVFADFGFQVFDFSSPLSFGSSDREMRDSIHGSEINLLRILMTMSREDPVLRKLTDLPQLEAMLENAHSPIHIYPQEPE